MSHEDYPCLGARAALRRGVMVSEAFGPLDNADTTVALHRALLDFIDHWLRPDENFATFVAVFSAPTNVSEKAFELALWRQLTRLSELDARTHSWAASVDGDPSSPDFAFSVGGEAFFVVGMHDRSSRSARRFPLPTLAFNHHAQFDRLKAADVYGGLQERIRARELRLQGSLNPNLAEHGEASEARQYSGRAAEADWSCPFHVEDPPS
ncbi:YqcI/YcgG family protein [Stackebrandtia soli]